MRTMLTVKKTCELVGIPMTTIDNWIKDGTVTPALRLGRGRGRGDRFSPQQAVALVFIGGLRAMGDEFAKESIRELLEGCNRVSDEQMERWIKGEEANSWKEEVYTAHKGPRDEEERRMYAECGERVAKVLNYLRDQHDRVGRILRPMLSKVSPKVS